MSARFDDIKQQAARVRQIHLTTVLQRTGAVADKNDPAKWHTRQGQLSVTGSKFFNWTKSVGGGGAIDLIMHLESFDFIRAVCWLSENGADAPVPSLNETKSPTHKRLALPNRHHQGLPQVIHYLTSKRCIPASLLQSLINASHLYADERANAVFLILGKGKAIVGAEIRGTTQTPWHALAPGSRKDRGFFYIAKANSKKVVICESAIDALSYFAIDPGCIALSTAGAHPNPPWLSKLIQRDYKVYCGFDADDTGDKMAEKMIILYPGIKRLRPSLNDWNDVLKNSSIKKH